MAIGAIDEIVNNENLLLKLGGDTFILMQDCRFNLDRPISRQTTSGGGAGNNVVYFFGSGDNSIDFTLLCSTPELEDSSGAGNLVYQTQRDANGALPTATYKIKVTDVSGATKTISATGVIPHLEVQRMAGVGGVVMNGRIQLTGDTVTVA